MSQPVIVAENLRKEFGRVVALRGVSFQVETGAFFYHFWQEWRWQVHLTEHHLGNGLCNRWQYPSIW